MNFKALALCSSFLGLVAMATAPFADAQDRIRIRTGGKTDDTVVIDETSVPPTITISNGEVRGAPGSINDLGGGVYEILSAGNAYYHLKMRTGIDSVTVYDGPGNSKYWLGVGKDSDTVTVYDGPGEDEYKIEGKRGDDVYEIVDGPGDDYYYIKAATGFDVITFTDSDSTDTIKVKARPEATLTVNDVAEVGEDDELILKGVTVLP